MKQRTKALINITIFIIAIIVLIILFHVRYDVYRLSPNVCTVVLDTSPKEFMNDQGEGTILDGGYTYAKIDTKGNLVLILTNEESDAWKNSDFGIQILAKLWEGERDIGIQIKERDYDTTDPLLQWQNHQYDAAITSGLEVSDDYTKVIADSNDDTFYYPWFIGISVRMQVFEGVSSEEIRVEYIEYDANGQIVKRIVWPDDADEDGQIHFTPKNN